MANEMDTIQQTADAKTQAQKSCRIFVSYSHKDFEVAQQFMQYLRLGLRDSEHLGIEPDQVFFDRNNLLAGDQWDESIQCALEEADYFIFLVSVNSLSSQYCYERELKVAASNALPILLVLLESCPWKNLPIPGDRQRRTLNIFHPIPGDFRPITVWTKENPSDQVWTEVVAQLTKALSGRQQQSIPAPLHLLENKGNELHPTKTLLPYFCNQNSIVNEFSRGIGAWRRSALLILVKGISEDDIPNFWERLLKKDLQDFLSVNHEKLAAERPFKWGLEWDQQITAADMMMFLSDALTNNKYSLPDVNALHRWLTDVNDVTNPDGIISLTADLPVGKVGDETVEKTVEKTITAQSHNLRTLLGLFEKCPPETPLNRLVIAIFIEDEALIKQGNLSELFELTRYQRTTIIELEPLETIDQEDVRIWHRQERERLGTIDEKMLLTQIFPDSAVTSLRMRPFAEKIHEIIDNHKRTRHL